MLYLRLLAAGALATMALMIFSTGASATTLEVGGVTKNVSVAVSATVKTGTSLSLKDTFGSIAITCTASNLVATTTSPFTGSSVTGPIQEWSFSRCTRTVTTHKQGALEITWTSGTNGSTASEEAEFTVGTPIGTLVCKTIETTTLGTLTGVGSGNATMDLNAVLNCGIISSVKLEGTYTITSPSGLGVSP